MKKIYEAPILTELTVGTADVMLIASGEVIVGGKDPYTADIGWDLL